MRRRDLNCPLLLGCLQTLSMNWGRLKRAWLSNRNGTFEIKPSWNPKGPAGFMKKMASLLEGSKQTTGDALASPLAPRILRFWDVPTNGLLKVPSNKTGGILLTVATITPVSGHLLTEAEHGHYAQWVKLHAVVMSIWATPSPYLATFHQLTGYCQQPSHLVKRRAT